jgi:hypothetical protein
MRPCRRSAASGPRRAAPAVTWTPSRLVRADLLVGLAGGTSSSTCVVMQSTLRAHGGVGLSRTALELHDPRCLPPQRDPSASQGCCRGSTSRATPPAPGRDMLHGGESWSRRRTSSMRTATPAGSLLQAAGRTVWRAGGASSSCCRPRAGRATGTGATRWSSARSPPPLPLRGLRPRVAAAPPCAARRLATESRLLHTSDGRALEAPFRRLVRELAPHSRSPTSASRRTDRARPRGHPAAPGGWGARALSAVHPRSPARGACSTTAAPSRGACRPGPGGRPVAGTRGGRFLQRGRGPAPLTSWSAGCSAPRSCSPAPTCRSRRSRSSWASRRARTSRASSRAGARDPPGLPAPCARTRGDGRPAVTACACRPRGDGSSGARRGRAADGPRRRPPARRTPVRRARRAALRAQLLAEDDCPEGDGDHGRDVGGGGDQRRGRAADSAQT